MSCLEIFTIRLVVEVTLEPTEGVPIFAGQATCCETKERWKHPPLQVSGLRIKW